MMMAVMAENDVFSNAFEVGQAQVRYEQVGLPVGTGTYVGPILGRTGTWTSIVKK
jgi:hypothetical protein